MIKNEDALDLDALGPLILAEFIPALTAMHESYTILAIKDALIAADLAQRAGALDIHQAMMTRARRLLGTATA